MSNLTSGEKKCDDCGRFFDSQFKYNRHVISCAPRILRVEAANAAEAAQVAQQADSGKIEVEDGANHLLRSARGRVARKERSSPVIQITQSATPSAASSPVILALPRQDAQTSSSPAVSAPPNLQSPRLPCSVNGCNMSFISDRALNSHKRDIHAIGGRAVDLTGREAYMLSQSARNQLQQQGLLRRLPNGHTNGESSTNGAQGQGIGDGTRGQSINGTGGSQTTHDTGRGQANNDTVRGQPNRVAGSVSNANNTVRSNVLIGASRGQVIASQGGRTTQPSSRPASDKFHAMQQPLSTPIQPQPARQPPSAHQAILRASLTPNVHPVITTLQTLTQPSPQASLEGGGTADYHQARSIIKQILRLKIQANVLFYREGYMMVSGMKFTRIPIGKQDSLLAIVDALCTLPPSLQYDEFLPPPKGLRQEYVANYTMRDFESSPARMSSRPGLDIVVLACSKIVLEDNTHEIVKLAAVDLPTGRVLLHHLVCMDLDTGVKDWRSDVTGLQGYDEIEKARQAGIKVLKGWPAARTALWKFVDAETIIVGHNLRADLDALRIMHGRAVDICKVIEKNAGGALSRDILELDHIMKEYVKNPIKIDEMFGRDCLIDAFAVREVVLWGAKKPEELDQTAKRELEKYKRLSLAN